MEPGQRVQEQLNRQLGKNERSQSYVEFKRTFYPRHLTLYETLCNRCQRILSIKPSPKQHTELAEYIRIAHLGIQPEGALSFAILMPLAVLLLMIVLSALISFSTLPFFAMYGLVITCVLIIVFLRLPEFIANSFRLRASNQMVLCIFYVVTYMRHTSNLELAINFAADRVGAPLSLDLKKVLWDVETEKYGTIKESLDRYLEGWRNYNLEFLESFHLIEGSLYETSEERRISLIEKALTVMLEETYEKMLHYSHALKNPLTLLYMLGVILPVLGLIILPLVASFLTGPDLSPYAMVAMLALLYNVSIPILVLYLGKLTLSKRPTGYGETDLSSSRAAANNDTASSAFVVGAAIFGAGLVIGTLPLWLHFVSPGFADPDFSGPLSLNFRLLGYKEGLAGEVGPYGLLAGVLSVFLILGIGLAAGTYFVATTTQQMKVRNQARALEEEFASALFQLGNRLGDGVPAEIAFGKVAEVMKGTTSGDFFELVNTNIVRGGMSVERAIFDPRIGAVVFFPSALIESTMRVLVESSKKGPAASSSALINVSHYIKEIHRVNERVRDLLIDILSDMKQQVGLITPAIAGIVVGITSMIVFIITELASQLDELVRSTDVGAFPTTITNIFGDPIPTFFFQIVVGLYVVEIIYILSVLINGIESGSDKLRERNLIGTNVLRGSLIYCTIAIIVIILFNTLATIILKALSIG